MSVVELGTDPGIKPQASLTGPRPSIKIELGESGGGFLERLGASIPSTTEGKVKFLERIYGANNVRTTKQGDILIPTADGESLRPFDESSFSLADVADIGGPAIPAIGALVGGRAGVAGAGLGAMAGATVRNVAGEVLSGGTGQTVGERAEEIATEGAIAAGMQGIVNVGAKVFDTIFRPHNIMSRPFRKGAENPFAKKGARLSEKTGVPLTIAETTGGRGAGMVESFAFRSPFASDQLFAFQQGQLRQSMFQLAQSLDKISPTSGLVNVGDDIVRAFDDSLDTAIKMRRTQAALDFGEVTKASNGVPVIPTKATVQEITRLVDEFDVPGAGDAAAKVTKQAKALLKSLTPEDGGPMRLTGEQAQRLLQVYTNAARGTGVIFKDMDKAQSRLIAGRVKDALLKDLDDAVSQSGQAGAVGTALKTARDNYRLNSVAVNEIADSTLSRLIGNRTASPEALADRFIKMRPSEVQSSMRIIESASPDAANAVRRQFIENAIIRARPPVTQQASDGIRFSASRFVSALPEMDVMKAAGFTRQEIVEIGRVSKVLQRVADKAYTGSPTAFATLAFDALRGAYGLNLASIGRSAFAVLGPKKIARAITTPEGRKAIMTLAETKPGTNAAIAAANSLLAITGTEPGAEDVRPLEPLKDDSTQTLEDILQ